MLGNAEVLVKNCWRHCVGPTSGDRYARRIPGMPPDGKQCQHALFGGTRMLRCQYVFFAGNSMISCRTEGNCVCLSSNHPQTVFMKCPLNFRSISAQFPLEAPILQGFEHFLLTFLSISARCVDLVFSAPLPPFLANFGATPKNKA